MEDGGWAICCSKTLRKPSFSWNLANSVTYNPPDLYNDQDLADKKYSWKGAQPVTIAGMDNSKSRMGIDIPNPPQPSIF